MRRCARFTRPTLPSIGRCRSGSTPEDRRGYPQAGCLCAPASYLPDSKNGRNVAGGQVVGAGIVVDVSRHFNRIIEIDAKQGRVRVQPGVVRNELNLALVPHGIFFAPETSTQNRCMIGGMVGNNACGANSVVYGSTREHLVSARAVLSDGSIAEFGSLSANEFEAKCSGDTLEASALSGDKGAAWRSRESRGDRAAVPEEIDSPSQYRLCHRPACRTAHR